MNSLSFRGYLKWLPDELFLKIIFRLKLGYPLNLKDPKTFNEKLQWLKLYNRNPLYSQLVDKYEVRSFVADKIGKEHLIPLLGVWNRFDEIDFSKLPNAFVLKCTHDSGNVIICRDKSKFDKAAAKKKIEQSLQKNYYWPLREWPYKNVKPRLIAEKYLEDEPSNSLNDYKIFCFNGSAKVWLLISGRSSGDIRGDYYDFDGNRLPFKQEYPNSDSVRSMTPEIKQMKVLAEKLTQGMKHCRADFYLVDGRIYFGELTFFDSSGLDRYEPAEWDLKFGNLLDLEK